MKDFKLCEKAQQNRERGMYREGILNPNKENEVVSINNLRLGRRKR
jgi:hypothetical protein